MSKADEAEPNGANLRMHKLNLRAEDKIILEEMAASLSGSRVFRLTSRAKLGSNSNDMAAVDAAIEQLRDSVDAHTLQTEERTQLEITALLCGRFDFLKELAQRRLPERIDLSFAVRSDMPNKSPATIEFEAISPQRAIVHVSSALYTLSYAEVLARRSLYLLPMLCAYLDAVPFIAGSFFMDMSDHGSAAAFSFSGHSTDNLIPDPQFLETNGYSALRAKFKSDAIPWPARRPTVFWRGSSTGVAKYWRDLPRAQLCAWAATSRYGPMLDIKMSSVVQRSAIERDEIDASGLLGAYSPPSELASYKYHIDIDGNTNSWPGLFTKLLSGSPVIKIKSAHGYKQWYYAELRPWGNYIPAKSDLSDLNSIVAWLLENDDEAMHIGQQGAELAQQLSAETEVQRTVAKLRASSCVPS